MPSSAKHHLGASLTLTPPHCFKLSRLVLHVSRVAKRTREGRFSLRTEPSLAWLRLGMPGMPTVGPVGRKGNYTPPHQLTPRNTSTKRDNTVLRPGLLLVPEQTRRDEPIALLHPMVSEVSGCLCLFVYFFLLPLHHPSPRTPVIQIRPTQHQSEPRRSVCRTNGVSPLRTNAGDRQSDQSWVSRPHGSSASCLSLRT